MDKITLYGANMRVTKTTDEHAPSDRREAVTVEGIMRSPSDGYHTFDELYDHRISLFITLCRFLEQEESQSPESPHRVWRAKVHSDGSRYEDWFLLGIGEKEGRQITYHIPMNRWQEADFAITLDRAPFFDGHTSQDVLERLKKL